MPVGFAQTYAGLRVLDLSENIAGPLACMILADLGADVIKIERPGAGEATRSLPPTWGDGTDSTVFLSMNRNKRSAAIDLRSEAGRDAVLNLAGSADVVVESFRPGAAERLGLGVDDLSARRSDLVHCAISAFGTGPLGHHRPGYDALLQAYAGIMTMTGEPGGEPCRAAPSIIDMSTGMWAAMAIMAALTRRDSERASGEPARVQSLQATLIDSALFLMSHQVVGYLGTGEFPGPLASAAPSASPYGAFATKDEPVMIATSTDRQFQKLCEALDLAAVAADPRFAEMPGRIADRAHLHAAIAERLATDTSAHWLEVLGAAGIPAGPVQDLAAAVAHPVTLERGLIAESEAGRIPGLRQLHLPMDRERVAPRRQPPAVGEHTADVLREAGCTDEQVTHILNRLTTGSTERKDQP